MDNKYYETELYEVRLTREYNSASILDIGGGGEGVIGHLYGNNVIAIDRREDELLEVDNDSIKIVMDATDLNFPNTNFDVVTFFFTLMYMNEESKQKAIREVKKVISDNGVLEIWDVEIPAEVPNGENVFLANVNALTDDRTFRVTYGVGMENRTQTLDEIKKMMLKNGFMCIFEDVSGSYFNAKFKLEDVT